MGQDPPGDIQIDSFQRHSGPEQDLGEANTLRRQLEDPKCGNNDPSIEGREQVQKRGRSGVQVCDRLEQNGVEFGHRKLRQHFPTVLRQLPRNR